MTDRKIIETMSQAECEAAEWADMLDMCREERDAALARVAELEARAEAAKRERDSANIEAALEQTNAREAWERVAELEAALTGDIQAVTADGRQHRIRRGDWRPYPASLYEAEATE